MQCGLQICRMNRGFCECYCTGVDLMLEKLWRRIGCNGTSQKWASCTIWDHWASHPVFLLCQTSNEITCMSWNYFSLYGKEGIGIRKDGRIQGHTLWVKSKTNGRSKMGKLDIIHYQEIHHVTQEWTVYGAKCWLWSNKKGRGGMDVRASATAQIIQ